jgi:lysophospholipase
MLSSSLSSISVLTRVKIYIANGAPPPGQAPLTNTTTGQTVYNDTQLLGMFDQATIIASQGFSGAGNTTKGRSIPGTSLYRMTLNELVDAEWPLCLGCALFERSRAKEGVARAPLCESCFTRYCWDGSYDGPKNAALRVGGSVGVVVPLLSVLATLMLLL